MTLTSSQLRNTPALAACALLTAHELNRQHLPAFQLELNDTINAGRRGYCPGVVFHVQHENGAQASVTIQYLHEHNGGLRAAIKIPVPDAEAQTEIVIREEDKSELTFDTRLHACLEFLGQTLKAVGSPAHGDVPCSWKADEVTLGTCNVSKLELPDHTNLHSRGYCPGYEHTVIHTNGSSCTVTLKELHDIHGGVRATISIPIRAADVNCEVTIREEDSTLLAYDERMPACLQFAYRVLSSTPSEPTLSLPKVSI